jgi:hypothetical protein
VAYRDENNELVKKLQHKIVRSFCARALAIQNVHSSAGSKTPGVDKKI